MIAIEFFALHDEVIPESAYKQIQDLPAIANTATGPLQAKQNEANHRRKPADLYIDDARMWRQMGLFRFGKLVIRRRSAFSTEGIPDGGRVARRIVVEHHFDGQIEIIPSSVVGLWI